MDDWFGSCSKAKGDCGFLVGVSYGPNNQGAGAYNDGRLTVQPNIGFGNVNGNYYMLNSSYQQGGLQFNGLWYTGNGFGSAPQVQVHASMFAEYSTYLFPNVQGKDAINLGLDPYFSDYWQTGNDGSQYACDNNNCNMVSGKTVPIFFIEETIFDRITGGLYSKFVKTGNYINNMGKNAPQEWSSVKSRINAAGLPTTGKIRYVPPKGYSQSNPLPRGSNGGYKDRFGNEWTKGPSRTQGQAFEWGMYSYQRQGDLN